MSSLVSVEEADGVLIIMINRPEARNAISFETAQQLSAAFETLDARDDLRIGILTGAGGTFCSGMDLKDFAKTRKRSSVPGKGFGGLNEAPPQKPLIAAVEGFAVAGGFEMMLACDLIVAANNAMFGLPEVKRGLVAISTPKIPCAHPYSTIQFFYEKIPKTIRPVSLMLSSSKVTRSMCKWPQRVVVQKINRNSRCWIRTTRLWTGCSKPSRQWAQAGVHPACWVSAWAGLPRKRC